MKSSVDQPNIEEVLMRGVEHVYPSMDYLKSELAKGPRTLYFGIDPTGPSLHLGHVISLMKLRELQDLGHRIILLIGDFTGMIGDPTDKTAARKRLTRKEVLANAKSYKVQAGKLLRFSGKNAAQIKYNSKWLAKLTLAEVVELGAHFTVQQMLARDMFDRRMKENKPIHVHEFLYPLMQAYDSVAMDVDGEIGGNDQTFNMLAGRTLMKETKNKEKFVVSMKLLVDASGKKMGKTEGEMVALTDSADEMFGKIMSWTDGMIVPGFELLTRVSMDAVALMEKEMKSGALNPREAKERLAKEVVALFYERDAADVASRRFNEQFTEHKMPENIPVTAVKEEKLTILDALVRAGLVASKSEARNLIDGGGIKVDGHVIEGYDVEVFPTKDGVLIQKGKRHFARLVKS